MRLSRVVPQSFLATYLFLCSVEAPFTQRQSKLEQDQSPIREVRHISDVSKHRTSLFVVSSLVGYETGSQC